MRERVRLKWRVQRSRLAAAVAQQREREESDSPSAGKRTIAAGAAAVTGRCNLFALSSCMNYEDITMAAQKARRKATLLARGGVSYAEVVHHLRACAGDVKQDASCLLQFPRFFRAPSPPDLISGRRHRQDSVNRRKEGTNERVNKRPAGHRYDRYFGETSERTYCAAARGAAETRSRASGVRARDAGGLRLYRERASRRITRAIPDAACAAATNRKI